MSKQRTLDGLPISAGISGFTEYSTYRTEAPTKPAPVLVPSDLMKEIKELKLLFANERVNQALTTLFEHVQNKDNPHNTDLNQFTSTIVDVLYEEYKQQGGSGNKEYYTQSLFKVLRVASLEEMKTSTDPDLLVSIKGARAFIQGHEKDPDAHKELFNKLLPGAPVTDDPAYCLQGMLGASEDIVEVSGVSHEEDTGQFTFIGSDRCIHYFTGSGDFPVDWAYGEPLLPCFGRRYNYIPESANIHICVQGNVRLIGASDTSPDGSNTATAVFSEHDTEEVAHSLTYEQVELEIEKSRTFSVHAKSENCRYFAISFTDMLGGVETRAVFDLKTGGSLLMNHFNRYSADIYPLANGWYRCSLTMHHPFGRREDIKMTFFKDKETMRDETAFTFQGNNELLGYLWGMQLEDGRNMSPYIPTNGAALAREPYKFVATFDPEWENAEGQTIHTCYRTSGRILGDVKHPVFTVTDSNGITVLDASLTPEHIDITRSEVLTSDDISIAAMQAAASVNYDNTIKYHKLSYRIGKNIHSICAEDKEPAEIQHLLTWVPGTKLLIGHDTEGHFLEGYVQSVLCYQRALEDDEIVFTHGEELA